MKRIRGSAFAAVALLAGAIGFQSAHAVPVALELSLVIDVSGSVSTDEYNLQRTGYANAFLNPGIQAQIASFAGAGGMAVNVLQFSTSATESIGWTLLKTTDEINAFAAAVGAMPRAFAGGNTGIANAMSLATEILGLNSFEGARRVIDLSADGFENTVAGCNIVTCAAVQIARNDAAAEGIVINGLPILLDLGAQLETYFANNVITATGFIQAAANFDDFGTAAARKIGREITPVPEPGSLALLGAAALAGWRLRRRRA